jgi:hypothetical protein
MTYSSTTSIDIHAFILAEGGSLRLRPLTEHLPTSLVPVGGTPILDHQIQTLLRAGVGGVTVVGGYRAAQVEQACRAYPSVRFCTNPRFSRGEPLLSSLRAPEAVPESPVLVLRGDLLFDGGLLKPLLDAQALDARITARGRGIGLYRLTGDSFRALIQNARDAFEHRGPDPELFPYLESFLATRNPGALEADGTPWARVVTMEDLARALKTGEALRRARVAEGEDHRFRPAPAPKRAATGAVAPKTATPTAASAPSTTTPTTSTPSTTAPAAATPSTAAPEASTASDTEPKPLLRLVTARPEEESAGGVWLPRPLLRVLHR